MAAEVRIDGDVPVFAEAANAAEIALYGQPGTPSVVPLDILSTAEADAGEFYLGTNGFPRKENLNAFYFSTTKLLKYLYERGVAEWNTKVNYPVDAYCVGSDGNLYRALIEQSGNDPVGDATNWQQKTGVATTLTGYKNQAINGNLSIHQYADIDSSPIAVIDATYQTDRFESLLTSITGTIQRLIAQTVNTKKVNTLELIATSTASGIIAQKQKMENFLHGQEVICGAWIKSNNSNARILLDDGVSTTSSTAHTGGGAFEFLTVTKTISASATKLESTVGIISNTGTSVSITNLDNIQYSFLQLEFGDSPTGFEERNIALESQLAFRYYFSGSFYSFKDVISTVHNSSSDFKSQMRVSPTIVFVNPLILNSGGTPTTTATISSHTVNKNRLEKIVSGASYFGVQSDFTADAEL